MSRYKNQSVINLDPIERTQRQQNSILSRFFKTRRYGGKPMKKTEDFGHWLFVGKQRAGKTASMIWTFEQLVKKWKKKNKKIIVFSNMGIGIKITRSNFLQVIQQIEYDEEYIHIFLIDEIQAWFPKDTKQRELLKMIDDLTGEFSQLGKRQIYVLSTAQVYGRLNKNLREQCVYMINCRGSIFRNMAVNDYILGEDVMCDELGRWSGIPIRIKIHGLAKKTVFDTHKRVEID